MKVGFIGLGVMGSAIAKNLQKTGGQGFFCNLPLAEFEI
jgi:3-hydroxyisobutyrate dehydrogenase-like beta-hydroxyacid dehydrogenase